MSSFFSRNSSSPRRIPNVAQIKQLPRALSAGERKSLKVLITVLLVAVSAVGAKFASEHLRRVPAQGGDYVEATVGEPHYINPVLASSNDADRDIVRLVFSGLTKLDENGKVVPDIAEKFTVSEDGKTYTFALRQGVQWHDGTLFSSRDVAMTVAAIKNPAWKSPLYPQFKNASIETPDDQTVVFALPEPSVQFLAATTVGILPEHLWQDILPENASRAELNIKPVGTGPYRFKSYSQDKKGVIHTYTLSANALYYGGRPNLQSFTFLFYPDFGAATETVLNKKATALSYVSPESEEAIASENTLRVTRFRLPQYTALFFNVSKAASPLADKSVRQALAYAVDKEALLADTLQDRSVPAYGPILPGFPGFTPDLEKYSFDAAKAAAMLDAAGWKVGDDGIRAKAGKGSAKPAPLSITIATADTKELTSVAEKIRDDWQKVGVSATVDVIPRAKLQKETIRTKEYDALVYGEIVGPDGDLYPFWHSSQAGAGGLNLSAWQNKKADTALEQARASTSETQAAKNQEFQNLLLADEPAIFLYTPTYSYAANRSVKGIGANLIFSPADRFTNIEKWYIETALSWE